MEKCLPMLIISTSTSNCIIKAARAAISPSTTVATAGVPVSNHVEFQWKPFALYKFSHRISIPVKLQISDSQLENSQKVVDDKNMFTNVSISNLRKN